MFSKFVFNGKIPMLIDREAFHRNLRNLAVENNLPKDQEHFIDMLELLFTTNLVAGMVMDKLKEAEGGAKITQDDLEACKSELDFCERELKKWECFMLSRCFTYDSMRLD